MTASAKNVRVAVPRFSGATKADPETDALETNLAFLPDDPNHKLELEWLDLGELWIDPDIQRGVVHSEVKKIVKGFNEAALGTITVSSRETPTGRTLSLLDGQQRVTALRELGYDKKVAAMVHYGLTRPQEARLFLDLNFRRAVTALRQFRTQLTAEDPTAVAIKTMLDDVGIEFGGLKGFNAVTAAERIYRRPALATYEDAPDGPTCLKWALSMVHGVYDLEERGGVYNGHVIEAFSILYRHFAPHIDQKRLAEKLLSMGGGTAGISTLIGQGRTIKSINPNWHISFAIGQALVGFYNRHKRTNPAFPTRLPDLPRRKVAVKTVGTVPANREEYGDEEFDS